MNESRRPSVATIALAAFTMAILIVATFVSAGAVLSAFDLVAQRYDDINQTTFWVAGAFLALIITLVTGSAIARRVQNLSDLIRSMSNMENNSAEEFNLSMTKESVGALPLDKAIELIKFYEDLASTIKSRTWAITTWVLTLNAALLAYSFQLYLEPERPPEFLLLVLAISIVGIALSIYLFIFISDQGQHLRHYWTMENKVGAWNSSVRGLVMDQLGFEEARDDDYSARFPQFAARLRLLAVMFALAFAASFLLFTYLS